MGLFGPAKKFSPLALEMAKGMWSQGAQMSPQTPLQLVDAATKQLFGAIAMRRQNKARMRAKEATMERLGAISGMQPKTQTIGMQFQEDPMQSRPLTPEDIAEKPFTPVPDATMEVPAESRAEFFARQQKAKIDALMSSEIPRYQEMGEALMLETMTKQAPEFKFHNVGNSLVATDPMTGDAWEVFQGQDKVTVQNYDPTKPLIAHDSSGNVQVLSTPTVQDAPDSVVGMVGDRPFYFAWDEYAGRYYNTGIEAQPKSGQQINVYPEGSMPPLTSSATTQFQTKLQESKDRLRDIDAILNSFNPEFLTMGDRINQKYLQAKSFLGLGLTEEELRTGMDRAEFYARVQNYANLQIKYITGAQMSEKEATRLLKGIPHAKEDPLTFAGKMRYVYATTQEAIKAYEAALKQQENPNTQAAHEAAQAAADAIVNSRMSTYENMSDADWTMQGQAFADQNAARIAGEVGDDGGMSSSF